MRGAYAFAMTLRGTAAAPDSHRLHARAYTVLPLHSFRRDRDDLERRRQQRKEILAPSRRTSKESIDALCVLEGVL